ncbi:prolipoprotein diacylglyceryl transferase [Aminipila sp.]|uniref:prolipoprotein diacylglyceryl transferase n=1 Tax=Aminipila sp. TaxID=2060095 RepID=UPI000ED72BE0|nr:prolipoprotein diacylglyceryl transferase [Aminipila sp.]HCX61417.1 prolipoprotein diacylglyceryl transferase [Clostridiales bacterium]
MKELFSIGPFHIYFFGVAVAVGIAIGTIFAINEAKKRDISSEIITDLVLITIISGIVGARLFYILFYNPSIYFNNPVEIFKIYEGGLSIHGGIFTAIVAGYIYTVKKKKSFLKLADIIVTALPLAQGIGRVGCDVFGKTMSDIMPWGINYGGQILHPAQVYEFILDYILFIFLWRRSYHKKFDGELFAIYLISFPIIRGIVEFFRINPIIWGPFSISHLLSLILVIIGIVVYKILSKNSAEYNNDLVNKEIKLSTSILYLIVLIAVSVFVFYYVQG